MVRARVQEVVDFATSTAPYQNANKGWLTDDIYLQLGSNAEQSSKQKKEFLNIFFFWEPIKKLISILFVVVALASILVVSAISYSHGNLHISFAVPSSPSISKQLPKISTLENNGLEEKNQSAEIVNLQQDLAEVTQEDSAMLPLASQDVPMKLEKSLDNDIQSKAKKSSLGTAGNLF